MFLLQVGVEEQFSRESHAGLCAVFFCFQAALSTPVFDFAVYLLPVAFQRRLRVE